MLEMDKENFRWLHDIEEGTYKELKYNLVININIGSWWWNLNNLRNRNSHHNDNIN